MRLVPPGHSMFSGILLLRSLQPVKEMAAEVLSSLVQEEMGLALGSSCLPTQLSR